MKAGETILVIEDDENDQILLKRAFHLNQINNPLRIVANGKEAMDYLSGRNEYQNRTKFPFPSAIVTDLKLPICSGLEFLRWLNGQSQFRIIPTLVLSSSRAEVDVVSAYDSGAQSYFVKPATFNELQSLVRTIWTYWNSSEALPVRNN